MPPEDEVEEEVEEEEEHQQQQPLPQLRQMEACEAYPLPSSTERVP